MRGDGDVDVTDDSEKEINEKIEAEIDRTHLFRAILLLLYKQGLKLIA